MVTPRVRLMEPLAQGGMAEVWIAEHLGFGTRVAVKFVTPELLDNHIILERFRREARAAARIRNAHVVRLFDHGLMRDGTPFIVMELLVGETLGQRLDRVERLPLRDVAELVQQVAEALTAVHELGIVHRDIKPDNLFLCPCGGRPFVKLLDFGVAAFKGGGGLPKLTRRGVVLGTPHYLSPERIYGGARYEASDDVWALAVVAYEALTGFQPFAGDSIEQVLRRIREGTFVRPSALAEVSPEIDEWFLRALHRDPEARFATAQTLASHLAQCIPVASSERARVPATPIPVSMATHAAARDRARSGVLMLCAALACFALHALVSGQPPTEATKGLTTALPSADMLLRNNQPTRPRRLPLRRPKPPSTRAAYRF
ncbi:MAG TPA: serine/threonine-protein kinase [Polyangiaceae bacterium]|nr:serine/threonine-protein kinase [Polyangiaceae bacterium]